MKSRILSLMDTPKKKAGAVVLCGALLVAIGAGTTFAANSITSLQVKMENGIRSYSTDDGKTWSQNAPDGVVASDQDGKLTIMNGIPPKNGEGQGLLVKVENGVTLYSTDGGKTWSEKAPDGVTIGEDGAVMFKGNK
ncbi:MAG: exo-alpha-sialidase [Bacillota bacterium]